MLRTALNTVIYRLNNHLQPMRMFLCRNLEYYFVSASTYNYKPFKNIITYMDAGNCCQITSVSKPTVSCIQTIKKLLLQLLHNKGPPVIEPPLKIVQWGIYAEGVHLCKSSMLHYLTLHLQTFMPINPATPRIESIQ